MALNRKILIDLIAMLVVVLIGIIGYKLSPLLLPTADLRVMPDPGCDLNRSSCAVALPDGGSVELTLAPRPIPLVTPLRIAVRIEGAAPRGAWADFAGAGMAMGLNRPRLHPREAGQWEGETSLPVCVTGQMTWEVTLLLERRGERIAIPFRFQSAAHA